MSGRRVLRADCLRSVGINIDGPRAMHDTYRVDKGGKPTYDRALPGTVEVIPEGASVAPSTSST